MDENNLLEGGKDELKKKKDELEKEKDKLKNEIEKLEKKIEKLETEINNLKPGEKDQRMVLENRLTQIWGLLGDKEKHVMQIEDQINVKEIHLYELQKFERQQQDMADGIDDPCLIVNTETYDLPLDPDGNVSLTSLQLHDPAAVGLKFKRVNDTWHMLTTKDGKVIKPEGGWKSLKYVLHTTHVPSAQPSTSAAEGAEGMVDANGKKERVRIFLDNSNFWIGAKRHIGEDRRLKCEDGRVRTEFGKLLKFIAGDRPIANAILYGSEPPPSDSVWGLAEKEGWKINLSHKSPKGKEKEVDTKMVADIVETVCTHKPPETVILLTGDIDFVCAVHKAIEHNWKIEVYGWSKSMSLELKQCDNDSSVSSVKIKCIDASYSQFMITEFDFKMVKENSSVRSNGIVLEISAPDRMENIEAFCERLVEILHWPVQYNWLRESHSHLAILLGGNEEENRVSEVLKTISDKKFDFVKNVMTYNQYHSNTSTPAPTINTPSDNDYEVNSDKMSQKEKPFVQVKKQPKKQYQKYSESCIYKFNCQYGKQCEYKHTEDEKFFFTKCGRPIPRRKTALCKYFPYCKHKKKDCIHAHGEEDAWCTTCLENGHFAEEKCVPKKSVKLN